VTPAIEGRVLGGIDAPIEAKRFDWSASTLDAIVKPSAMKLSCVVTFFPQ
jgi:hypothetical protein